MVGYKLQLVIFFKGHYEKWQALISIHLENMNQDLKNQWGRYSSYLSSRIVLGT